MIAVLCGWTGCGPGPEGLDCGDCGIEIDGSCVPSHSACPSGTRCDIDLRCRSAGATPDAREINEGPDAAPILGGCTDNGVTVSVGTQLKCGTCAFRTCLTIGSMSSCQPDSSFCGGWKECRRDKEVWECKPPLDNKTCTSADIGKNAVCGGSCGSQTCLSTGKYAPCTPHDSYCSGSEYCDNQDFECYPL